MLQNLRLQLENLANNKVQVISQFEQTGSFANRYDVSILVNGLPLVQVELKKRGVAIREVFNQVHRYSKESFNSSNSLFKFLQIFVISNGTKLNEVLPKMSPLNPNYLTKKHSVFQKIASFVEKFKRVGGEI